MKKYENMLLFFLFFRYSFYWIFLFKGNQAKDQLNNLRTFSNAFENKKCDLKVSEINQEKYENLVIANYKFKNFTWASLHFEYIINFNLKRICWASNVLFEVDIWLQLILFETYHTYYFIFILESSVSYKADNVRN